MLVKHCDKKHGKKLKPRNARNLIVFLTSLNYHGSKFNKIINRKIHLLLNNNNSGELHPEGTILVASKKGKNLQQLLMRSDPCNMNDQQLI